MKRHWLMTISTVLVVLLTLPSGMTQAQAPIPGGDWGASESQVLAPAAR